MATTTTNSSQTAQRPAASTGEAAKFAGQPYVLHAKLNRAVEELFFFKVGHRHHNERESSIVKTHAQWKADACELCQALRDAIMSGALEPEKPKADE